MTAIASTTSDNPPGSDHQRGGLMSPGFIGLLLTQLLGAANDNIFRWYVIGIGKEKDSQNVAFILAFGMICFVLPYLLFAAHSGYLAD